MLSNVRGLRWLASGRGLTYLAFTILGALGAVSWLCHGAFVLEWWLAGALIVLAAWLLISLLLSPSEAELRRLLAHSASALAPLGLALGWVLVQSARMPYVLGILSESAALGGAVAISSYLWLVPQFRRLPRPLKAFLSSPWPFVLVLTIWTVAYTVSSVSAWWNLTPSVGDTPVFEEAIYNTLQGRFLMYGGDLHFPYPVSRFADHFDPILLLFVPLWALWPTGLWLLLAQVGVVASGAIPIARLARRWYALPAAGLPFALAYLLHPGVHSALTYEFHPEVFAAPLILWGLVLGLEKRFVPSAFFFFAAICCKENIPAVVCLAGLFLAHKGERRYGVAVAVLSLVCGVLILKVVFPHFSPWGHTPNADLLDDVRRTRFLTGHDPSLTYLRARLSYLLEVMSPVLGLCLLAPMALLISASETGLHLLSRSRLMSAIAVHYHVTIVTGVVLGGIAGLSWLADRLEKRLAPDCPKQRANLRRAVLLGFAVASLWDLSHSSNLLTAFPWRDFHRPTELVQRQRRLLAMVPDEVPVLVNAAELMSPLCRRLRLVNRMKPGKVDSVVLQGCREFDYLALKAPPHV